MKPLRLLFTAAAAITLLLLPALSPAAVPVEAISLTTSRITFPEGPGARAILVARAGGTGAALAANLAVADPDGNITNYSVNFATDAATTSVNVTFAADAVFTGPRTFTATLTTSAAGVAVSPINGALIQITDDEDYPAAAASYEGIVDIGKASSSERGPITITAGVKNAYSAKLQLGTVKYSFKGFFDNKGASTVVLPRKTGAPFAVVLQRYERAGVPEILGDVLIDSFDVFITARRVLTKTELANLPAEKSFVGAFTHSDSGVVLGAPTQATLSKTGVWSFAGVTFDNRKLAIKTKALNGGYIRFAHLPFGKTAGVRLGFLQYDAANHRLNGNLNSSRANGGAQPVSLGYFSILESGPLAAYTPPATGVYPGAFVGGVGDSIFSIKTLGGAEITAHFQWTTANKLTITPTPDFPFTFKFNAKTGLVTGKLTLPDAKKATPYTLALTAPTGLPAPGIFLGTIPDGDDVRQVRILAD